MNPRNSRAAQVKGPVAPMYRNPASVATPASGGQFHHAPNAALLIDFDNVTMGIQKDLHAELKNLLSSDIIKGKVAVQRAYADWRRYVQYITPLTAASIDMIMAPAYGSAKKNATDIRLAVDAMELVFTRPEIGTFILLSGDSDFSSLVIKLKEYGKYVIGVGIRESSSDLLVMNCDEYYSYNALAGLVKSSDEEHVPRDPWELAVEAITRMQRNGDVMRSDRLKQVMQEIDHDFDEKNLGMSKFSRFCQEAAQRGLIRVSKLENGQMEVSLPDGTASIRPHVASPATPRVAETPGGNGRRKRGGSRGGRGGRARDAKQASPDTVAAAPRALDQASTLAVTPLAPQTAHDSPQKAEPGSGGERLTRTDAFDIVKRAVSALVPATSGDDSVLASEVRRTAREMLGRDSETLSERNFVRILRDAHDANVIDLRKRGDDYEVAPAAASQAITAQVQAAAPSATASQAGRSAATANALRRGMGHRGARGRIGHRGGQEEGLPADLFSVGVVEDVIPDPKISTAVAEAGSARSLAGPDEVSETKVPAKGSRGRRSPKRSTSEETAEKKPARRSRARKKRAAPVVPEG